MKHTAKQKEGTGKRRRAREMAVQMLYQHDLGGASMPQIFASFDLDDYLLETEAPDAAAAAPGPLGVGERGPGEGSGDDKAGKRRVLDKAQLADSFAYARRLVEGAIAHAEAIDEMIRDHAENWRLERMPIIDRNILRLAIYEMLFEGKVPKVVIVDEAIELAKKFGSEQSGRFVNGLLDGILKSGSTLEAATVESAAAERAG